MRWEYFGTGLALIGIGVTLMVALPPSWWPKMPQALVHIAVVSGGILTIAGVAFAVFGAWPVLPNPKMAIVGMSVAVLLFFVCATWLWLTPSASGDDTTKTHVQIILSKGGAFEAVAPAGVNRRRTVRAKIENNTDNQISNGTLRVLNLDPPYRDQTDFLLKSDISIPARGHTFVDIAYYDEGTSTALRGKFMYLAVPSGAFFAEAIPSLPIDTPHTFHLKFSTLEGDLFYEVYCRLFVDADHILRLENRGDTINQKQSARIPLNDLIFSEAPKVGWQRDGDDDSRGFMTLVSRMEQAAVDGALHFWGKTRHDIDDKFRQPLIPIPSEHWHDHEIDLIAAIYKPNAENFSRLRISSNENGVFFDLHLGRDEALRWLQSSGRP